MFLVKDLFSRIAHKRAMLSVWRQRLLVAFLIVFWVTEAKATEINFSQENVINLSELWKYHTGKIHKEIRIDLPRPRDPFNPKVIDLEHETTEAVRGN